MPKPRKIGVLTFHRCINYGSYWQARCLVEGLRSRGFDAELLDHHSDDVERAELRCAFQPKLPERSPRSDLRSYGAKARLFHDAFRRLPLSRRFSLHQPEQAGSYDAIVVGSDEVWNFRHPWYGSKPIFFGDGLKADRLVSYAASFGNHSAWHGIHGEWAAKLDNFSAISVRDENSSQLVREGIGAEPTSFWIPAFNSRSHLGALATIRAIMRSCTATASRAGYRMRCSAGPANGAFASSASDTSTIGLTSSA